MTFERECGIVIDRIYEEESNMTYRLNWDEGAAVFPAKAAECMRLASPKAVKVLMYLCVNKALPDDPSQIDRDMSRDDIEDAVAFWRRADVIMSEQTVKAKPTAVPKFKAILPSEIAQRMEQSEHIRSLFGAAENIYGRPLVHDEQRTLIWIHDHLALPTDVMIMLIGYSHTAGKGSMAYIEKTALDWCERGINTLTAADEELIKLQHTDSYSSHIASLLKISRFTAAQLECLDRWDKQSITDEMILKAAEVSTEKKLRIDIKYMDGILRNWQKGTSPDAAKPQKKDEPDEQVYSVADLEQWIMRDVESGDE